VNENTTNPDPSNSIATNTDESSDHKVESLGKPGQLCMKYITVSLMNINAAYLRWLPPRDADPRLSCSPRVPSKTPSKQPATL